MKKGFKLVIAIFGMLGLMAMVITPIFLLITSYTLRDILPQWYMIINVILSGCIIIAIFVIMTLWISEDKTNQRN